MDDRDLVEPEGINAGSDDAMRDAGGAGDPVPGGLPERAEEQQRPEPADGVLGAPPDPDTSQAYGSEAAGSA